MAPSECCNKITKPSQSFKPLTPIQHFQLNISRFLNLQYHHKSYYPFASLTVCFNPVSRVRDLLSIGAPHKAQTISNKPVTMFLYIPLTMRTMGMGVTPRGPRTPTNFSGNGIAERPVPKHPQEETKCLLPMYSQCRPSPIKLMTRKCTVK